MRANYNPDAIPSRAEPALTTAFKPPRKWRFVALGLGTGTNLLRGESADYSRSAPRPRTLTGAPARGGRCVPSCPGLCLKCSRRSFTPPYHSHQPDAPGVLPFNFRPGLALRRSPRFPFLAHTYEERERGETSDSEPRRGRPGSVGANGPPVPAWRPGPMGRPHAPGPGRHASFLVHQAAP